jgi:hypothetical protein
VDQASGAGDLRLALPAATVLTAFPLAFVTTFCNVGFLAMAQAHFRGEQPSVRAGLRFARSRLGTIVRWSLLSALVGGLMRTLEQLPGGGEIVARVLGALGGIAWSMATFFVIPILVVEGGKVNESIVRSAAVFRKRWGETTTGSLTIGGFVAILIIPLMMLLLIGVVALLLGELAVGVMLVALGAGLSTALLAVSSAVSELFQLLVYRETTEGRAPGPFSSEALGSAFQPRRRLWPRRASA